MGLRDYIAVLRHHWPIWLGVTALGVVLALTALLALPRTFEATAEVFVSSTTEGPETSQFVNERVKSYPAIATSDAVLDSAMGRLGMDSGASQPWVEVEATSPVETAQVDITVVSGDAELAANVANAVAVEFSRVVQDLERPTTGVSPVRLTVTDAATVPTVPTSPVPLYVLTLGTVAGLLLGLSAAVVRSKMSRTLHTESDVRATWGDVEVLTIPSGRGRHDPLAGRAAPTIARHLERIAGEKAVRVCVVSPSPGEDRTVRALLDSVADELRPRGVRAIVHRHPDVSRELIAPTGPGVALDFIERSTPIRAWRHDHAGCDTVLLVVTTGRVDARDLEEVRSTLQAVGAPAPVVVLTSRRAALRGRSPSAPRHHADAKAVATAGREVSEPASS